MSKNIFIDANIVIDFFDGNSGTVNSFNGVTDVNGHVQFTYTAPVDLTDLNGTTITFRIENTTALNNKVDSIFTVSSTITEKPNIHIENNEITIGKSSENISVKVLAFNSDNEVFNSGSIVVRYPNEIVDDNVSGGKFDQQEVAILNGEAIFDFVGPDPLVSIDSLNFTFIYKEDDSISTTLSVNYIPEVPTIVLDDANITVTTNGEIVNIGMNIYDKYNAAYPDGSIMIKYPSEVLTGKDVGSFNESSISIVDGRVSFIYTAPNPLDGNDSLVFTFYHDSQPILSQKDLNITVTPDADQVVLTSYTLKNIYEPIMNLEATQLMSFSIIDDNEVNMPDSNITSIKVSILNPALGTLKDTAGNTGDSLTINSLNNVQISITSYTISGVIPIQVDAQYKDANNNDQNLTEVFNIVVVSGPASAMSLSYASTEHTEEQKSIAKFVENWVLTVTDKYNNPVNSNPAISMGMLAGYTQSSAVTSNVANYLYFDTDVGGILTDVIPNDQFTAPTGVFDNVNQVNETLVLFGDGYTYNASGKWDINTNSSTVLDLIDDYNGSSVSDLGFAVGSNYRQDRCDNGEVVANVYPENNNYILDDSGSMIIKVEYDYYLVGKSVMLWTNLIGDHNNTAVKIGEAKKITLRGLGLDGDTYAFDKGFTGEIRLNISITDTVEFYKNANFVYAIELSGEDASWNITGTSMDNNITSCVNNGTAYVDINITGAPITEGEVKLTNLLPSREF